MIALRGWVRKFRNFPKKIKSWLANKNFWAISDFQISLSQGLIVLKIMRWSRVRLYRIRFREFHAITASSLSWSSTSFFIRATAAISITVVHVLLLKGVFYEISSKWNSTLMNWRLFLLTTQDGVVMQGPRSENARAGSRVFTSQQICSAINAPRVLVILMFAWSAW